MTKKIGTFSSLILGFIVLGVVYNYQSVQRSIRDTQPSVLATDIVSYPEKIISGNTGTFFWNVQTPSDLTASMTTIYWGYESSPSAVTVSDPPQSLGYSNSTSDYLSGNFKLPDTFDSQLVFTRLGKVYFRSYAKVGDQHLWSEEYSLTVLPPF